MKLPIGLVALSVMATLVLSGGHTADAKSPETDTTTEPAATQPVKKEPVVVTVQAGETLTSIAEAHNTTYIRIFNANESLQNPDIIDVGNQFRIPEADEQLPERPLPAAVVAQVLQAAPAAQQVAGSTMPVANSQSRGVVAGNGYVPGNCTWYVKNRRADLPNNLGNGGSWVANASARGFATGTAPAAGAVAEQPGHVAYVESVNGDGTVNISEMNYAGGLGQVHYRTAPASMFRYIY